jgi:uncharacterized phage-associated protein
MNIYREKLLNAVLYFAKETIYLNLTKISKLLYYLDFEHFKKTGCPSIGLDYYSFNNGPVPRDFWLEIREGNTPEDFASKLSFIRNEDDPYKEVTIKAIAQPDLTVFSPREVKLLQWLAEVYKEARGKDMTEVSHLPNQPWDKTCKTCGMNELIDYMLAIDDTAEVCREDAEESLKEHREVVENFSLKPTK